MKIFTVIYTTIFSFAALTCAIEPTFASTRSIGFTGTAAMNPTNEATNNAASTAECILVVTNQSNSQQELTQVSFQVYSVADRKLTYAAPASLDRYTLDKAEDACGSVKSPEGKLDGAILSPGATCILKLEVDTIPSTNRVASCMGKIIIKDVESSKPGSVVASGAILTTNEAKVLGGSLSGAVYLSGTHLSSDEALTKAKSRGIDFPWNGTSNQMNPYCINACLIDDRNDKKNRTSQYCQLLCGGNVMHVIPTLQGNSTTTFNDLNGAWTSNAMGVVRTVKPTIDNNGAISGFQVVNPDGTVPASEAQAVIQTLSFGNGHFAGGTVLETITGPIVSICTANQQAWNRGATDFTHAGGVDDHAVIAEKNASLPPERLMCSHRHGQDDLYMGVTSSSSFVVNGGLPF